MTFNISSGLSNFPAAANNWDKEGRKDLWLTLSMVCREFIKYLTIIYNDVSFNFYFTKHKKLVFKLTEFLKWGGNCK